MMKSLMTCRQPLTIILLLVLIFISCTSKKEEKKNENPVLIKYSIHSYIPHDTKAFTEGFTIHNGKLYESTGLNNSWIGVVDVQTGIADKKIELDDKYFGEGITILNNKIYQLTWKNHVGFVYSLSSHKEVRQFTYKTEGWGLTNDNKNLIMSDGTNQLYFLDTATFTLVKTLSVKYENAPLQSLNELEFIDGYIYANIWQSDRIAKIDVNTGEAVGFLELTTLSRQVRAASPEAEVLNGIAWHASTKSLLVTGKYWSFIYVLKI